MSDKQPDPLDEVVLEPEGALSGQEPMLPSMAVEEESAAGATGRLVRSSALVGLGTGLSRLTGLLRVGALAYALGTTLLADSYNLANTTPNIIYELILGGILSATLVPVFVEHLDRDDRDGTSAVVTVVTVALAVLTVVGMFAAPWIIRLYTIGLDPTERAEEASVAVPLLRLFIPQIFLYGLTALGTALLNARRTFAVPAFAPVLNNVVVICVLLAVPRVANGTPTVGQVVDDRGLLLLLGLGTTAGIAAMTLVLIPAIHHAGIRLRWRFDWRNPAVRTVARLSGWTIGYAAANQVTLFVVLALAVASGEGHVSAYTYAFIFFQLPHGLFAVSIMTTFVPDLSGFAARRDLEGYRERFALGLRLIVLVVLPAAAGYVVLARPLIATLLERGAFGSSSAELTAEVLAAMALGLVGFSVYLFALRGFYTFQDTRTPFFLNLGENGLNLVLAVALVGPLGVQGLALAYAAAYSVAAVVAVVALDRRIGHLDARRLAHALLPIVAATAAMTLAVWGVTRVVGSDQGSGALVRTAVGVVVGAAVYLGLLVAFRAEDLVTLRNDLRQRRRKGEASEVASSS